MRRRVLQLYIKKQKNDEVIFSLAWNIMFADNWKVIVLDFLEMKNVVLLSKKVGGNMIFTITGKFLFWSIREWEIRSFLSQDVDEKMIFSGYWEVLVLNFSVMRNAVSFSAKTLMERWYLICLFEVSMIF